MAGRRLTYMPLGIDRGQPENTHQALNAFAVYTERDVASEDGQQAAAVKSLARILLVDQAKQQQVLFALEAIGA